MCTQNKQTTIMTIVLFLVLIGGGLWYLQTWKQNPQQETNTPMEKDVDQTAVEPSASESAVSLTIVNDKNCEQCDTEKITGWLKGELKRPMDIEEVEFDSEEGQKLLAEYEGKYLPFILFGNEIGQIKNIGHLEHHTLTQIKDRYLVDLERMGATVGRYLDIKNYEKTDTSAPKIVLNSKERDIGEVKLSGGTVQSEFLVKNEGGSPLVFLGINTSCGCTSAKVVLKNEESPVFKMAGHGELVQWRGELPAGEEAKIIILYDPTVHPDLNEAVMREVYIKTNDPNTPEETIRIFASQKPL